MGCNLIAITPDRFSDTLVDQAVSDCALNGKKLIVLIVDDPSSINKAAKDFRDNSLIGSTKEIAKSLKSHSDYLLKEDLLSVEKKAEAAKTGYEEVRVSGDFVDSVIEAVRKYSPDALYVCRLNTKSSFARFLHGSAVDKLQKNCSCRVVVV